MITKLAEHLSSYTALILKFKSYPFEETEKLWEEFCERNPRSIEMYIPYGWKHLALALDESITKIDPGYHVAQVKEKFGGGRYYVDFSENSSQETIEIIHELINLYEKLSKITCVTCGNSTENEDSWKLPYCQGCRK